MISYSCTYLFLRFQKALSLRVMQYLATVGHMPIIVVQCLRPQLSEPPISLTIQLINVSSICSWEIIVIIDATSHVEVEASTLRENNRRERLLSQGNLIACFNSRLFKFRNTIYSFSDCRCIFSYAYTNNSSFDYFT